MPARPSASSEYWQHKPPPNIWLFIQILEWYKGSGKKNLVKDTIVKDKRSGKNNGKKKKEHHKKYYSEAGNIKHISKISEN